MKATAFAVHHNVAVWVFCAGIFLLGSIYYAAMPRESFPEVKFPFILVTTTLDGANPSDVEESVTIPIESELEGLEGVKEMRSVSSDSVSMISLEFFPDVDLITALNRVRDAVDQAKPELPPEAKEPAVKEFSIASMPVVVYHLVGEGAVSASELNDLAESLKKDMLRLAGVLDIDIFGGREREVVIEVDPQRLHMFNLSLTHVRGVISGANRNVSAGTAETKTNRIGVRVPGAFQTAADIYMLVIGFTEQGTPIYLKDVATVRYDFEDETSLARVYFPSDSGDRNFYRAVSLQIKKRTGANILDLSSGLDAVVARRNLPSNIRVVKGLDQSRQVKEMVEDLENGIGTSLILVVAVIFFGLGWRNSILVASAIPLSMLMSIIVLTVMGQTLNMMVLFSLILSLGMLVDNAIVIVENIYRHFSMGKTRVDAAIDGTSEVAWPVITSTATTVGAFMPLVFWPGMIGEFMSFLPRTVIVVLLCSLFVALIVNPTLAASFMKLKSGALTRLDQETTRPTYWLALRYRTVLEFLLDRPGWTLMTSSLLLVVTLASYGIFGAGVEMFPPVDPELATCSIKPPEGISLTASDALARQVEARILGLEGSGYDQPVENIKYASTVVALEDGMGGGFGDESSGPVRTTIEFIDRQGRRQSTAETIEELRLRIQGLDATGRQIAPPLFGAEFDVIRSQEGPPTGRAISIDLYGKNLAEMARVANDMKRLMRSIPGTAKPMDNASAAQPTLEWLIDRPRAGMMGLDQATISSMLEIAVGGVVVGSFGHGDEEQDIRLRMPEAYRLNTDLLKNITIPVSTGGKVPIASVASAKLVPGPVAIQHYNQRRVVTADCEMQPGVRSDGDARAAFRHLVENYPFPAGMDYRLGGAAQDEEEAKDFLEKAFLIAIFVIIMVMVLQFNSLPVTAIVLSSVVLSLMGVFAGLIILQAPLSIIMTGIAIISLAGIVVNNAIVLLDAIRQQEKTATHVRDAIITASMIRLRPVVLTAVTTILGLVPMALKFGLDFRKLWFQYDTSSSQWWQSMAVSVIFGLLISTGLTLGVVPSLYLEYKRLVGKLAALRDSVR